MGVTSYPIFIFQLKKPKNSTKKKNKKKNVNKKSTETRATTKIYQEP